MAILNNQMVIGGFNHSMFHFISNPPIDSLDARRKHTFAPGSTLW